MYKSSIFSQASGQEAAVILGQAQVTTVSRLLGVEMQQLVVSLTQKETVSHPCDY